MIVVADTSPINYMLLIEHIDVLPALYKRVVIPMSVHDELRRRNSPQRVRAWAISLPNWCAVIKVDEASDPELDHLDDGERASIHLAIKLAADYLLMDERDGREAALARRLPVVGVLGVIEKAADLGLLDFRDALLKLERTNFRMSARLHAWYLSRNAHR